MQPSVDPGVLKLLTDAYLSQQQAYNLNAGGVSQPRAHTLIPTDRLGIEFQKYIGDPPQYVGTSGLHFLDVTPPTTVPFDYLNAFCYGCEALLPGGEAFDELGWSNLRQLKTGMPPWSSIAPEPYKVMARIAQKAGWQDSDMDRLAMWYVETGGQFVTYDRCRAGFPQALAQANAQGNTTAQHIFQSAAKFQGSGQSVNPETAAMLAMFIDGDMWSGRVWPKHYLDAPCTTRDLVEHHNVATFAVLAPIGIRPDGVPLACLSDPNVGAYLASIGVQSAADLTTPGTGAKNAQLAFEASLGANDVTLLKDFVIGPEREWFGNFAVCGGPLTSLTTLADVVKFYIPSSLIDYFNTVRATRYRPSFFDLGLATATAGPVLDANAHLVALEFMKAIGPERCLPVSERVAPLFDYSYFRFLRDMLHDGPGYAGFRGWPDIHLTATGPDVNQILGEVGAGIAFVVSIIGTAYTGGALSPAVALATTLVKQALSMEQTIVSLVNGIGWNNGSWHSYAGLSHILNSTQLNLSKLDSQAMSFVNGLEKAPATFGAALTGTTVTVGGQTVTI